MLSGARQIFGILLLGLLTACGGSNTAVILAPTPNLYTFETGEDYPAQNVPDGFRRIMTEVLYMTDRDAMQDQAGDIIGYGSKRNDSMAFGVSLVEYGELDSWEQLVQQTHKTGQPGLTKLNTVYLQELARFPQTPLPFERHNGKLRTLPEVAKKNQAQIAIMQSEISKRLRTHKLDRVLVYVHGFNNDFEDGLGTLANVWHYAGRQSLPIAYSWPAGNSGLLKYFRDVESGEYSVYHVKEFLRMLAAIPEVREIDIIAHSRGNAVMTAALRELLIEARASGRDPQRAMKTGVLVMAAPDLDLGVARQRLLAERFTQGFEQVNIYANPDDRALKLSKLIGRVTRLGSLTSDSFRMEEIDSLTRAGNVNFIMVKEAGGQLGHAYFRENPAVLSDIVLTLRSRQLPGSDFRPLERAEGNIWYLHPNYPAEELPEQLDLERFDR